MFNEFPIAFQSQGVTLRGVLVMPAGAARRLPGVVMAHGTSATYQMVAVAYARAFAATGLAVVLYDHRNLGSSDGEPRGEINPWVQSRGYVDALTFATGRPEIDPDRLALWGDSYSGGEVVVVSACDSRAKAVVAQVPIFGNAPPPVEPSAAGMEIIREILRAGDVTGSPETTTGPLPVVSSDQLGTPSLLTPIQAFRWFIEYGGRFGPGWVNRVTRVLPPTPLPFSPSLCAPYVQAPVLLVVAPDDEMVNADYGVARQAFEVMPEPKAWYDIADGHFGLLDHPGVRFDVAATVQAEFLHEHLGS